MNRGQRLIAILGAALLLVVALVVLAPGEDETPQDATTSAPVATAPAATTGAPATITVAPAPEPEPASTTVRVRGGKPVGDVQTIKVESGEQARIEVSSDDDTSGEIHLHGYDIERDLEAGGTVRFSFTADAEGIFEMELEETATQIAKVKVSP